MITLLIVLSYLILAAFVGYIALAVKKINESRDEFVKIRKDLELKRLVGWGLVILGGTNILHWEIPFPIPLGGQAGIYVSIVVIIAGLIALRLYYKPKVQEALTVAERTNGYLTLIFLMTKLGFPYRLAVKTLREMVNEHIAIVLNPDKQYMADIIFLVRSYSGKLPAPEQSTRGQTSENQREQSQEAGKGGEIDEDDEIREQHRNVVEMGVDKLNDALLHGSLNLGRSGRPVR